MAIPIEINTKRKTMLNQTLIHIHRKLKLPLDSIIKVVQKRHGSIYVYYNDGKSVRPKIAIAKQGMSNLLTIINTARIMQGKQPILGIYEK
jgi:hypothetical protein